MKATARAAGSEPALTNDALACLETLLGAMVIVF